MLLYFLQSYEEILTNKHKKEKLKKRPTKVSLLEVRGGVEPPWPVLQTGD